jgi:DNA polymerase I-like protein with 3'-5' exonuclease and polymerase domains
MTLAWAPTLDCPQHDETAYIRPEYIDVLRQWLESDIFPKVGSNIYGYDKHVLRNVGISLRGIRGDTQRMSQLLDPSKLFGHNLKTWGERLGFITAPFASVASRLKGGKERAYKKDNLKAGRYAGAVFVDLSLTKDKEYAKEVMSLHELWDNYPQRRTKLMEYAVQDAVMSLAVYYHLREQLNGQQF